MTEAGCRIEARGTTLQNLAGGRSQQPLYFLFLPCVTRIIVPSLLDRPLGPIQPSTATL